MRSFYKTCGLVSHANQLVRFCISPDLHQLCGWLALASRHTQITRLAADGAPKTVSRIWVDIESRRAGDVAVDHLTKLHAFVA